MGADRNLLLGLLALQNGIINQVQLVAAFQAWTLDKTRSLADHLEARGDLIGARRVLLEGLVEVHLEAHGGDVEKSLAAVAAVPALRRSLAGLDDPDLAISLAVLARGADARTRDRMPNPLSAFSRVTLAETNADKEITLVPAARVPIDGAAGRFELLGEIARGGMGAVFKARDPILGRDLALKVLLDRHRGRADLVNRFVEEAQVCGQLQHPGVVPVYELGSLSDRRPFFAMKLVKGRTLAKLLAERSTPANDLPRFLSIFEAVCQTVAYAHARGVIHRDLKPPNVMVGSFGEVQVMDWGLAKVLPRNGQPVQAERESPAETVVATIRSTCESDLSQAGSVLGTPAYMAPEQARGETDVIDRPVDVFALGSILCEILTGRPAFSGESAVEVLRAAGRADLADALDRLAHCQADEDLLDLVRDCLAPEPKDRPADAGVVAGRLTAYLAGVQERLRAADLARAAAAARAAEAEAKAAAERKARRLTGALAVMVLLAGLLGGASWRWNELQRIERAQQATDRVNQALREATRLRGLAQGAALGDIASWALAAAAAEKARDLLEPGLEPGLRKQVEDLAADLAIERKQAETMAEADRRDRRTLAELVEIRSAEADDRSGWGTDATYAAAFHAAGLDADRRPTAEVAAAIRARPPSVAVELAAAIDNWAAVRRDRRRDRAGAASLSALARAADPDPWRNGLRDALDRPEQETRRSALRKMANAAPLDQLGPISLDLLGRALNDAGELAAAESVLRRAQRRHPDDVWINYDLASTLERLARRAEAIRYYTAARSLRPETAHELAHVLNRVSEFDEATAVFEDLRRRRPDDGRHLGCLGVALRARGRSREADAILEAAVAADRVKIATRPDDTDAHTSLAWALKYQGKLEEAIAEYRAALRIRPDDADAHYRLGLTLDEQGKLEEAIAEYRAALRIRPGDHFTSNYLGLDLRRQGKLEEAIAELRTSLSVRRKLAEAHPDVAQYQADLVQMHRNLGVWLRLAGRNLEAAAEFRKLLRLSPDSVGTEDDYNLAWDLSVPPNADRRWAAEALEHARKAVASAPSNDYFQAGLALAEYRAGHFAEAIAAAERALDLGEEYQGFRWFILALAHARRGETDRARGHFNRAVDWTRKHEPYDTDLRQFWRETALMLGRPGPEVADPVHLSDLPPDVFTP